MQWLFHHTVGGNKAHQVTNPLPHRAVSLRDLVSRKYLHLRKHPLLSGEGNQAKDVLFLFNGMEKMKLDFRIGAAELCSDPNEALPPGVVVVNLLRKYLLPEVRDSPPSLQCYLSCLFCFSEIGFRLSSIRYLSCWSAKCCHNCCC